MNVKPDSIRYALGLLEREWGSYGYGVERVDGANGDWTGRLALVYVCASDGARFIIAADEFTGRWGYADGDSDESRAAAIRQHNIATYVDGRWTWPTDAGNDQPMAPYHARCDDCGHTKTEHDFPSGACGICVVCVDFAPCGA